MGCHIIPRGHRWDIIALNVHVSPEDKNDDTKASIYEELECVFNPFPKY
jgi:hypothetical protein